MPSRPTILLLLLLLLTATAPVVVADSESLLGFRDDAASEQRALEEQFDGHLDANDLRAWMERMAAHPHHVGSPWGKKNAEFMRDLFRSWGWEAELEEFWVLFPTPKTRLVEMIEPTRFVASLQEPTLAEDSTSGQKDEQLPTYNAYSVDGDVTAQVVYVNYGLPEDYEELTRRGIELEGKIALARYGGAWRGIKPKVAAEHGMIGCIIYTDPSGDGYRAGAPYPESGWRPNFGVQRGSVADMPTYPGDPLTPFVGATKDAERLDREDAATLTKIPVLPISADDALPIIRQMRGAVAPGGWRGALPTTYHLGPGPAKVRLKLEFDWSLAPAYNVVAKMPGSVYPDQWILRGNHHDAWVNGATDPVSGMVAVLAEAKAIGELTKTGWRPKRTLVYAGWDAEEPGLLGSVEWAELHADELREKAVAYINSDSNSRGFFYGGGSHTLERMVNQAAASVDDPQKEGSAQDRTRANMAIWGPPATRARAESGGDLPLAALGSGSDFTPFLQHIGIASLNVGFGGEGKYGQYHSIYDSFDHYLRFMDPDFSAGVALAQTAGRMVLRLSEAEVLPFRFGNLSHVIETYVDELVAMPDAMREETERQNRWIDAGYYEAVRDPDETKAPPERHDPVPFVNFAPLRNAQAKVATSAKALDSAIAGYLKGGANLDRTQLAQLNELLFESERALTRKYGLPERPWFRHFLYAPGFYTGYGVKTLPGVREAIEQRDWKQAEEQIDVAAEVLNGLAAHLDKAAATLAVEGEDSP